jgi:hypothetical protein
MNFWMNYFIGASVILIMVVFYTYFEFRLAGYKKAKAKEIAKDKAEFGYCCGLEDGVCTFEPKLKKINEININAAEKN